MADLNLWSRSGDRQFEREIDQWALGAYARFRVGGTTTPLETWQDYGQTQPHQADIPVDGYARWPSVYIAANDVPYSYDVFDSQGDLIYTQENVPNPSPSGGAAPGPSPALGFPVGFIQFSMQNGTIPDWVRLNGNTIGSAASGASEFASNDVYDLYVFLWTWCDQTICPVIPSRGGSADADWNAAKPLTLPDFRDASPRGVTGMGSTPKGGMDGETIATGSLDAPGSEIGVNQFAMTQAQLAQHLHAVGTLATTGAGAHTPVANSTSNQIPNHQHSASVGDHRHEFRHYAQGVTINDGSGSGRGVVWYDAGLSLDQTEPDGGFNISTGNAGAFTPTITTTVDPVADHVHPVTGSTANTGAGENIYVTAKSILGTFYINYTAPAT